MAEVLVLTRQDGTTEIAHIGSPYLAVVFEETFHRTPDTATDAGWLAFYDLKDRPPENPDELKLWLKEFIGTDLGEYQPPDPTETAQTNGSGPDSSSPT